MPNYYYLLHVLLHVNWSGLFQKIFRTKVLSLQNQVLLKWDEARISPSIKLLFWPPSEIKLVMALI